MIRSLWMRSSGLAVVLTAICLPYGLRWRWAYLLNFVFNRPSESAALLLRRPSESLNRVLIGALYFLGLGASSLFRPRRPEESFWRPRPGPEEYARGMEDPF
jgi:hypothetical protein